MGKSWYFSGYGDKDPRGSAKDNYVELELQMRKEGNRHPGADDIPSEQRPIMEPNYVWKDGDLVKNPRAGQQAVGLNGQPRFRPVKPNSALGFGSEDFHYSGDRIVTLNEEVEVQGGKRTGRILHRFQRIDDQGKSLGTYEQAWEPDSRKEGRMRSTGKARKYYSF